MANVQLHAGPYRQSRLTRSPARRRAGWIGTFALILAEAVLAIVLVVVGVTLFAKLKVATQNTSVDLRATGPLAPRIAERAPPRADPVQVAIPAPVADPPAPAADSPAPVADLPTPSPVRTPEVASPTPTTPAVVYPVPPAALSVAVEADDTASRSAALLVAGPPQAAPAPAVEASVAAPVEAPAGPEPAPPPVERSEALPPAPPATAPMADTPDPISQIIPREVAATPDLPRRVRAKRPRVHEARLPRSAPKPQRSRSPPRSAEVKTKEPAKPHRVAKKPKPRPHLAAKRARPRQARAVAPAATQSAYSAGMSRSTGMAPSTTRYMPNR